MSNAYIPRELVHLWSEAMADAPEDHTAALTRLLKEQRRLSRFIQENAEEMDPGTAGVANYMFAVLARLFDMAGGRLKSATWAQVRAAQAKVGAAAGQILPHDQGFAQRVRQVEGRAQPHILDEALMTLFEKKKTGEEVEVSEQESVKLFFLMWVAVEVLDGNWRPGKDFHGLSEYEYVYIEPDPPAEEE